MYMLLLNPFRFQPLIRTQIWKRIELKTTNKQHLIGFASRVISDKQPYSCFKNITYITDKPSFVVVEFLVIQKTLTGRVLPNLKKLKLNLSIIKLH